MIITGNTNTRLNELKKSTHSTLFEDMYYGNGSYTNDGVDYTSTENNVIYYIGGVKYNDVITGSNIVTNYSYTQQGYDSPDFINELLIKNPNKSKLVSNPKINNDVFIERQEISVFEKNYNLEFIRNLSDVKTYASGGYFKIIKNS